ncbi:MAG: undecaprenyl-phosphate galactose phosphotransferase WbaP [Lentisphaeria bacterium]|nr:undecaprenyl-phosphate galactose phosphotransferase WbaP [Lentisphaeria bacterium]
MNDDTQQIPQVRNCPRLTVSLLVLTDLSAVVLCATAAVWGYLLLRGQYEPMLYVRLWPTLVLFLLLYEWSGLYHGAALYPGAGLGDAEELRLCTYATTIAFLSLGVTVFLSKTGVRYSRGVFLIAWALSIVAIPVARSWLRRLCARCAWWGVPCVVIGSEAATRHISEVLIRRPSLGLKPILVIPLDDNIPLADVPSIEVARELASHQRVRYAVLAVTRADPQRLCDFIAGAGQAFQHVLIVPELPELGGLWVNALDLGAFLGLEIRRNLLLPLPRAVKRTTDIACVLASLPLTLPLTALLALLVKLTSRGNVFYGQERVGAGGDTFHMWKFRTMVTDGDTVLDAHFKLHPEAEEKWRSERKLTDDPRVTPLGRFLRRTSLDELPQLWNVLVGEMSLVGPRPIVRDEVCLYGDQFRLYIQVRPGLTGLWQVSGRNDIPFVDRVALDVYYVRKWSVWLDLHVVLRTPRVVLLGEGAY